MQSGFEKKRWRKVRASPVAFSFRLFVRYVYVSNVPTEVRRA